MNRYLVSALVLICLQVQAGLADSHRHPPINRLEKELAGLLEEKAESVRCDARHFIFGVGYIDGSYMERIFYVEGAGDRPAVTVEFRGAGLRESGDGEQELPDIAPASFIIELQAPRVRYATPTGDGWRVSDEDWETALRFKYTSWYGEVRRENGEWKIDWQGYRRPMLPESVTGNREAICAMFAKP